MLRGCCASLLFLVCGRAFAADAALPVKAPPIPYAYDWTGFYVGGNFGWGLSTQRMELTAAPGEALNKPYLASGMIGGFQAGYNYQLPNHVVLGVEAAVSFADYFGKRTFTDPNGDTGQFISNLQYVGTARARLGYALGAGWGWFMPYVTFGFAVGENKAEVDYADGVVQQKQLAHLGWTAGAGVEFPLGDRWSARLDYQYIDLSTKTYNNFTLDEMRPAGSSSFAPQVHAFTLGLNYHPTAQPLPTDRWPGVDWENWSIHGQATYIEQGYRRFNSPYEGTNSLSGDSQINNTITATAFIGRKLWDGGEFYINPDFAQGFGLSSTFGLAGFSNGEAQKSNFPVPRGNVGRIFLRQTFGFGGEQETIEDGPNQIAGKQDVSRLTVSVGKFAVNDFFNGNTYAADPRTTFLNWNIWGGGSWDITMDQPGWTWGALADFNQKDWAFRAGYFLLPLESNVNNFDTHIPQRGEYIAELELRYALFSQPGKLRLMGWVNRGTMGGYLDALNLPMTDPDYPDITQTRQIRTNYGFVANLEQAITADLGVFSRATWSPGHTEIIGWTDVDQSLSFGAVLKGTAWGRPDDRIGVAGVIEGLSAEAQAFFAAGGLGILIGDGALNYRTERVLEAYYAIALAKWATLTLDYQYFVNPAFNADRGPVSIYSSRLHLEF
jgi:high affinity Mn2+ porin